MLQKTANTKATSIRGQKYVPPAQKAAKGAKKVTLNRVMKYDCKK